MNTGFDDMISTTSGGLGMEGLVAFLLAFGFIIIILLLILFAFWIIALIARWKLFVKAGEAGWKALIPIYNDIVLSKIAGISGWWVGSAFLALIPLVIILVMFELSATSVLSSLFSGMLQLLFYAYIGFVYIYLHMKLAPKFGMSPVFGVLMAIPLWSDMTLPIMYMILGFGKAEYQGLGGVPTANDGYAKQMEDYNKAYAKYEEDVKKYNEEIARQDTDKK